MNPLLEQFLEEARENLKFIEENIEELETADAELLNAIFRAAHTLKGGSGIVGFESVKNITHKAEDLLDMLRSNQITFQSEMVDALYDAFDEVLNLVEAAEGEGDIVDANPEVLQNIIEKLNAQIKLSYIPLKPIFCKIVTIHYLMSIMRSLKKIFHKNISMLSILMRMKIVCSLVMIHYIHSLY